MKKATRQQTKTHNTRLVLKTIYEHGRPSRADIARITYLTRPTVSSIVADLINENLVIEDGPGPSAGGKRPTLLKINHDAHQLLCIDLGSKVFRGALVNLHGRITQRIDFPAEDKKQSEALQLMYDLINNLLAANSTPILGIAIGTPGLIDPQQGIVRRAVNLDWTDLPLKADLESRYQLPVYVTNDSKAAALAEFMFGESRASDNLLVIKVGQGVSAGIVLDGRPFYGDGFNAGEIGHVVVAENGPVCRCGNSGCLETVISTRAILNQAQAIAQQVPDSYLAGQSAVDWAAIAAALAAGDTAVSQMVVQAGQFLGVAIANLIAAFNIHHVIISGRVSQFGEVLLQAIRQEAQRRALPAMVAETKIDYSTLAEDIVLLGSSAVILKYELGIV